MIFMTKELIEQVIEKYLPECYWDFSHRKEDGSDILHISVSPHIMIRVTFYSDTEHHVSDYIYLRKYVIQTYDDSLVVSQMFSGEAPRLEDGELDFDFIGKILRNYKAF
jgi:hypothetical protein